MVKEIKTDYEAIIKQESKPLILEFYSPTCGTCLQVMPIVEEVEAGMRDKYAFYKINVEEDTSFAKKHGVSSVPTLLFMKEGEVIDQHHGNITKEELIEKIEKAFK